MSAAALMGIPVEFLLFGLLLGTIAFLHWNTTATALIGALAITLYKFFASGFTEGPGVSGLLAHGMHEWVLLTNLLGLLLGFAVLARHVDDSQLPVLLPRFLPNGALGGLLLLVAVFILSSVLDNIASAIIGATIAQRVFGGRVHVGYLASLVACANAGGVGSVLGDTTTTMMWIAGVTPMQVLPGYVAAGVAFLVTAIPAARQQHAHAPITADAPPGIRLDVGRLMIVAVILLLVLAVNLLVNSLYRAQADRLPFLAIAVWCGLLAASPWRRPDWAELPRALPGAVFLLALVWCASLMPVDRMPTPSSWATFFLGPVSAVLDNIPLTALAIRQDGHDWGLLAYAVGFGGSLLWFGSSAGVAVANRHPQAKSVVAWLRAGWHVLLAYPLGYGVMLAVFGWQPASIAVPSTVFRADVRAAGSAAPAALPSTGNLQAAPVPDLAPSAPTRLKMPTFD